MTLLPFEQPAAPRDYRHPAAIDDDALLAECDFTRDRSSGPGGQHRNKVETQVKLHHRPTGAHAQAGERRSQVENKKVAVRRLRLILAVDHREPVPRGDARSALWRSRVRNGRIACNPEHHDYPALLAEAMDLIAHGGWDLKDAAVRLEVTASQLLKLVKDHAPALVRLNAERKALGLHPLK
ncbi:MAG: peptide chain release factor-like protein [Phycisphaerales bacterium]|nr:peptide chain release factor-like protein [Phycisphaerales bacterium]